MKMTTTTTISAAVQKFSHKFIYQDYLYLITFTCSWRQTQAEYADAVQKWKIYSSPFITI